mgnify:CR=1 FL=1
MSLPKRVVLVGPMGAGKSTIGRMLAKELGYRFLDSDRIIEERCGANIPWIFDVEGEDGFRLRETAMLEELSLLPETVLATGGGAIMRPENRQFLKQDAVNRQPLTLAKGLWKMFGYRGVGSAAIPAWFQYLRPDFHPWQDDNTHLLDDWRATLPEPAVSAAA